MSDFRQGDQVSGDQVPGDASQRNTPQDDSIPDSSVQDEAIPGPGPAGEPVQGEREAAETVDGTMESTRSLSSGMSGEMSPLETSPADIVPAEPGKPLGPTANNRNGPVLVSCVAERNRVYGSESVTFFAQVEVRAPVEGFTLRMRMPVGMEIETYGAIDSDLLPNFEASAAPETLVDPRSLAPVLAEPVRYVVWEVAAAQEPGARYEYEVQVRVNPALQGNQVQSLATVYVDGETVDHEAAAIQVLDRAAYLQYLPALYGQDEFMGRFLMLFESFWRPIEGQIDQIHYYLDPQLTPARFLPWMASWFRLSVESEEWTEAKQRRLLASMIWLYRKRGTKHALQEYLEILTGHPVEITEQRAKDFRLGASARLGVGIALGKGNTPHTFRVFVQLDPLKRPQGLADDEWAREKRRREEERRRLIDQLIADEKPAHTNYSVEYEVVEPDVPESDELDLPGA